MNTLSISKRLLVIPALLAISAVSIAAGRTLEKDFDVSAGEALRVDSDTGSITVESHSDESVKVLVDIEGLDEDDFRVDISYRDGKVEVFGKRESKWFNWGSHKVRFHIRVPEQFEVDLNTRGGAIQVSDIQGAVYADTSGGSLSFEGIKGDVEARTSGGSINVGSVEGDVNIKTSGGSIRVGSIRGNLKGKTSGGSIRMEKVSGDADISTSGGSISVDAVGEGLSARTSGGSITVAFPQQPTSACKLSTSAGSITAVLTGDIEVNLNARGSRVRSDFPVNGVHKAKRALKGEINGGGPELVLRTSAGSVRIVKK